MSAHVKAIEAEIEQLDEAEQAKLASDILMRLHGVRAEVETAWAAEALRRLEEIRRDEAPTFEATDVLNEARQRLRKLR